jgi:cysteine desulfuration protein SufE
MSTIAERQSEIVAELSAAPSWQDRYRAIIRFGRELPDLDEEHRVDANKVKGCQSQVWLHATLESDGTVRFYGDSDAAIVKGLVALVLRAFSGSAPSEIITARTTFVDELGLSENLSQTRANGLSAMLKQIKFYGVAFSALTPRG